MKKYALALEIAAVILLIALIAGVALPYYLSSKYDQREAEVKNNLHNIQLSIERYAVDHEGEYPPYLIGGDIRYDPYWKDIDNCIKGICEIQDRSALSDPLLREGYIDSYPQNPFFRGRKLLDTLKLQESVKDPLRNKETGSEPSVSAIGNVQGCRFGGSGSIMGNVSADYRQSYFKYKDKNGNIKDLKSFADFDGYGVHSDGNIPPKFSQPKYALPGQFVYQANGPVVAADPETTDSTRPIQPVEFDQYVLGVYGSNGGIYKKGGGLSTFILLLDSRDES